MEKASRIRNGRKGGLAPHARRTHWTLGKRRNDPGGDWPATLDRLRLRLERPIRGEISIRACAGSCGIDKRVLRRYLSGEFLPAEKTAERIASWIRRHEGR